MLNNSNFPCRYATQHNSYQLDSSNILLLCPYFDHSPQPGPHGLQVCVFPHLEQRLRHDRLTLVQLLHPLLWHGGSYLILLLWKYYLKFTKKYLDILTPIGDIFWSEESVDVLVNHGTCWCWWTCWERRIVQILSRDELLNINIQYTIMVGKRILWGTQHV